MIDLQRLLATQNFKSEKELKDFMNNIVGSPIPSFPEETLTNQEKAIDLVLDAYDQEPQIGFEYIADALELDPDCIEAYEFLGCCYDIPAISNQLKLIENLQQNHLTEINQKTSSLKYLKKQEVQSTEVN